MSKKQNAVTQEQAQAELDRRALPKGSRPRATCEAARQMFAPELRAIAGSPAKPAPAAKPDRDPVKQLAAERASASHAAGSTAWWVEYRAQKAAITAMTAKAAAKARKGARTAA